MRMFCVKCGVHVTATGSECPRCHFDTLTPPGVHPPAAPKPVSAETPACVCAACGHEQSTMDPCGHCRSVRVVLISVVRDLLGPNWRSTFKEQDTAPPEVRRVNEPLMHATIAVAARCAERDPAPTLAEARDLARAIALASGLDGQDAQALQRAAESLVTPFPDASDTLPCATPARRRPKILSLGGGLDSWAMLLDAERRGELPDVVAFVDVGDASDPAAHPGEWDGTYRHIAEVVRPWCEERKIEFVEISARTGYLIRPENQASRSLFQWLWDMDQIPVAGPNRICTRIAKVERFERWLDARYAGQEVEVWIGFDAGEISRAENDPNAGKARGPSYGRAPAKASPLREVSLAWRWTRALAWAMSHAGRVNRFPLMESGLCRCRCEALARASGYPVPRKSACQGCVYNTKGDWQRLAAERPDVFDQFVRLEAKKPLTKKGRKLTISAYDSRTQTGIPLSVLVRRPYEPQIKPCLVCGAAVRATKAAGCGYLDDNHHP